jgi:hypothetical protein
MAMEYCLPMRHKPYQFGISNMMWWVVFAAFHFWLCSLGAWGVILAVVIDKHVAVAYLCWAARVDRRDATIQPVETRQAA